MQAVIYFSSNIWRLKKIRNFRLNLSISRVLLGKEREKKEGYKRDCSV